MKGPWTKDEDKIVSDLVGKHGVGNIKWSVIAARLPGRLGKQARERWYNHLNPSLNKNPWTPEEDKKLMSLQKWVTAGVKSQNFWLGALKTL